MWPFGAGMSEKVALQTNNGASSQEELLLELTKTSRDQSPELVKESSLHLLRHLVFFKDLVEIYIYLSIWLTGLEVFYEIQLRSIKSCN